MTRQMIMGNQAIALGALKAGAGLAAGYPGTPSSEIIEFISKYNKITGTYVEWSANEKAAVEVAAGASAAGLRTIVTMKQVGLNVASDPVMCLSYLGVKGGMVIVSADDPGPISSQTEQDTRTFARFSKLPCFDPSTPQEAFEMVQKAFEVSEKYKTPVLLRPTTRVDHAYQSMQMPELKKIQGGATFEKDSSRWVIFPKLSFARHKEIFERDLNVLPKKFSALKFNKEISLSNGAKGAAKSASKGAAFVAGGISFCYLMEALEILKADFPNNKKIQEARVLKIGTPYPFPDPLAREFLLDKREVIVFEELDPFLESALLELCGKEKIKCAVRGKFDKTVPAAGELGADIIKEIIMNALKIAGPKSAAQKKVQKPELPIRPPVLCAGCPHRASFYAVKKAMKGQKTVYCGDIGCYTLGNAAPLNMTDTCLCMGADITMAQGFFRAEPDRKCFSFIGDSTFFASGMTGVVNAVYNKSRQTICILDNSTTAMTGHQPHPGTGKTMMGEIVQKISIPKILEAIGVSPIIQVDPFDQEKAVAAVKEASQAEGVSAIIFKAPCVSIAAKLGYKFPGAKKIDAAKCVGCQKCAKELGCPAISFDKKKAVIDGSLCSGCGLCKGLCPTGAIQ
ncbi:MAG: indolepyruvate ferredoxin oxidoreductase subunit alpha [Treponema sp.]|nr:indolepyruvate ferredoxin oxidoreductase subunit alpha [Treponema sp.]